MPNHIVTELRPDDRRSMRLLHQLLLEEGIRKDQNLDYTCGIFDDDLNLIATGSCFGNTLRCLAVSSSHQGEGLMNQIVTHLTEVQFARGNTHLFLYTKCSSAQFFRDLGFYEIIRVDGQIVFMENQRNGFSAYLDHLLAESEKAAASLCSADLQNKKDVSAIVMNANPFTLGHRYLIEQAANVSSIVHLFIVSEDRSLIPASVRKQLVLSGTADFKNVLYHDSGDYIISSATFPSYFQKDDTAVMESHARLDLAVFCRIAEKLGITTRFVGEEPKSIVTGIYNQIMKEALPKHGICCKIIPRLCTGEGKLISASTVREALKEGNDKLFRQLVPDSTYAYFHSDAAKNVLQALRQAKTVIHD